MGGVQGEFGGWVDRLTVCRSDSWPCSLSYSRNAVLGQQLDIA